MQWQRVLHGCGAAIEHVGKIHSVYEFTLKGVPGQIVRVRVVETPEGQFFGIPNHAIQLDGQSELIMPPVIPFNTPERALQEAVCHLTQNLKPPYDGIRLVKLQNW